VHERLRVGLPEGGDPLTDEAVRYGRRVTTGLPKRLSTRSPKGEQLREILEGLIGTLQPGDALPSERILAERYAVARMTVRSEIDRLVSEGLLYRVQGRGTFVAEPRVAQAIALSSFTEDMRARGHEPGSQVLEQQVELAGDLVARRLAVPVGAKVVRIHRVRTADGAPMAVEQAFLPAERFAGLEDADLAGGSLFELLEKGWGVALNVADQRAVAVVIEEEHAELLDVPAGQPGLLFRTVVRDATGRPVFYAWSLYRGDRYEIALRQER
jgi:DNA-binding GntR family transcriptional regulator